MFVSVSLSQSLVGNWKCNPEKPGFFRVAPPKASAAQRRHVDVTNISDSSLFRFRFSLACLCSLPLCFMRVRVLFSRRATRRHNFFRRAKQNRQLRPPTRQPANQPNQTKPNQTRPDQTKPNDNQATNENRANQDQRRQVGTQNESTTHLKSERIANTTTNTDPQCIHSPYSQSTLNDDVVVSA